MVESGDTWITVVIPTFRRPAMLQRAIASVAAQQQPVLTCVYDNGADPTTQAVVSAFARQGQAIRYYAHPENVGAHANFAYGLARVGGEFFVIPSDDAGLFPGPLVRAVAAVAIHPP